MDYENMTYEAILNRMLERVPNNIDKREGSIIYDALAPAAVELALLYIEFNTIVNESYADTASRDYLIRRASERGLIPYDSTQAILKAEFTPSTLEIPIGTRFSSDDLNYEVLEKISSGIYKIKCENFGKTGNKGYGTLIPIDYIENLETAEIKEILIPGEDEEDTEDFRDRYFASFEKKSFGGNKADYQEKVNSISGVGATKVKSCWNGGGTVLLTILDSNYSKASNILIEDVQNEIDPTNDASGQGIAPIGHIVTVRTADEVEINIGADITLDDGYDLETLISSITSEIQSYLLELRKTWANNNSLFVRISQIENKILNLEGVIDISNTKINNSTSNLELSELQIPVLGEITL